MNLNVVLEKKGLTSNKKEGDKKTPRGTYTLGPLYFRKDKLNPNTKLKKINKKYMGWCDDINKIIINYKNKKKM